MPARVKAGVEIRKDKFKDIEKVVKKMTTSEVLVGVPAETATRDNPDGAPINNAALAYVHNYGSERAHVPPRPFMEPGIKRAKGTIVAGFKRAGQAALQADFKKMRLNLEEVGNDTAETIKDVIRAGIQPPLKRRSVANRYKGRKDLNRAPEEQAWLDNPPTGKAAFGGMIPLINSAQMINSIRGVVREKGGK